jgi:hypothetical protein
MQAVFCRQGKAEDMWWRIPVGALINGICWIALGTLFIIPIRIAWPEYAAVERAMTFDLPMMEMRLAVSAVASLIAAFIAGLAVRDNRYAPLAGGLLLLALFVPEHIRIWDRFPIGYHATFLTSLPVLAWIGGRLAPVAD